MDKKKIIANTLAVGLIVGGLGGISAIQNASAAENMPPSANEERMEGRHDFMKNVERKVENITNGVIITLTTTDADTLVKLQNMPEFPGPKHEDEFMGNVEQSITKLDNGVQITLTSEDATAVQKLQNMPEPGEHHGHRGRGGPFGPFMEENVKRTVENIDKGVTITLTSEDADTVTELQNFKWEPDQDE